LPSLRPGGPRITGLAQMSRRLSPYELSRRGIQNAAGLSQMASGSPGKTRTPSRVADLSGNLSRDRSLPPGLTVAPGGLRGSAARRQATNAERAGMPRFRKPLPGHVEQSRTSGNPDVVADHGGCVGARGVRIGQAALNRTLTSSEKSPSGAAAVPLTNAGKSCSGWMPASQWPTLPGPSALTGPRTPRRRPMAGRNRGSIAGTDAGPPSPHAVRTPLRTVAEASQASLVSACASAPHALGFSGGRILRPALRSTLFGRRRPPWGLRRGV
jgi:hypothetical protein